MTVSEAAYLMGCSEQFLRVCLQKGKFTWGSAVQQTTNRWTYWINKKMFMKEVMGNE